MKEKNIIETTSDGSMTIYVPGLDEHYHSVNGALSEALTVFINPGIASSDRKNLRILEIGFGTGLNALLTAVQAIKLNKKVYYTAVEKYPVDTGIIERLNYEKLVESEYSGLYPMMHKCQWDEACELSPNFVLNKICTDIKIFESDSRFDLIYFDAFAKSKQPGMWTDEIIAKVCAMADNKGLFLTYSATGQLKRQLISCGFSVERLPGPKGKREITRAEKL